jgi:ABC-type phosphate/phosphonate transport system substrate-binding protein
MKRLLLFASAAAILFPTVALAQSSTKSEDSKMSSKTTTISGKVSDDAATITDDKDVHWTVTNPVMLEPFAGQAATVKGHPYKGENKIQVTSASGILPNATVVGNRDTSAFRR